jgi:mannose-1-phosphate guanylyltransferase/mannose-6-phosphate isomerase-like protein (cupin superfamily)
MAVLLSQSAMMHTLLHQLIPVILVGGTGSRLAEITSPECPKPFIPFSDNSTLFIRTLRRCTQMAQPVVVGNVAHRFAITNQAAEAQVTLRTTLHEARAHNTAYAVALAVAWMQRSATEDAVLAILPSDHVIENTEAWHEGVARAMQKAAQEKVLVLLGITPSDDSSAYGYIDADAEGYVRAFREKPNNAAQLRAQGWLWNSGQVIARANVLADALQRHAPDIWGAAQESLAQASLEQNNAYCADKEVAPIPFDCAVLEKADNCAIIPCDCGWSDVGTPDIFRRHAGLKEGAAAHVRIDRPWGYSVQIGRTAQTLSKELVIYQDRRISLQRHTARDEHWSVIEGSAEVTLDDTIIRLTKGEAVLVPRGVWHRLSNAGAGVLRVHEVQSGSPDEADIERAEDDYGRV